MSQAGFNSQFQDNPQGDLWDVYFPKKDYNPQFDAVSKKFIPFFSSNRQEVSEFGAICLGFSSLLAGCARVGVPLLEADFCDRPDDTLACMELAAHRVYNQGKPGRIHIRLLDFPTISKLKKLKANRKIKTTIQK